MCNQTLCGFVSGSTRPVTLLGGTDSADETDRCYRRPSIAKPLAGARTVHYPLASEYSEFQPYYPHTMQIDWAADDLVAGRIQDPLFEFVELDSYLIKRESGAWMSLSKSRRDNHSELGYEDLLLRPLADFEVVNWLGENGFLACRTWPKTLQTWPELSFVVPLATETGLLYEGGWHPTHASVVTINEQKDRNNWIVDRYVATGDTDRQLSVALTEKIEAEKLSWTSLGETSIRDPLRKTFVDRFHVDPPDLRGKKGDERKEQIRKAIETTKN